MSEATHLEVAEPGFEPTQYNFRAIAGTLAAMYTLDYERTDRVTAWESQGRSIWKRVSSENSV